MKLAVACAFPILANFSFVLGSEILSTSQCLFFNFNSLLSLLGCLLALLLCFRLLERIFCNLRNDSINLRLKLILLSYLLIKKESMVCFNSSCKVSSQIRVLLFKQKLWVSSLSIKRNFRMEFFILLLLLLKHEAYSLLFNLFSNQSLFSLALNNSSIEITLRIELCRTLVQEP